MNRSEPPRLARRLVEQALPEDLRESIVGDLDELFRARHREHGFLFGLGSHDIPTYALAAGVLTLTAGIACYLPARRAARLEPQHALRSE